MEEAVIQIPLLVVIRYAINIDTVLYNRLKDSILDAAVYLKQFLG